MMVYTHNRYIKNFETHKNMINIYEYLKTITHITFVNNVASTFLEFYRKSVKL